MAAAAAVITFMAFLPALSAGFVNWDDDLNFLANPHYRGIGPEQISWMFTTFHMGPYQPLAWLTLGLDYTLWGMDPAGYHFTSVLLHAVNAGLCAIAACLILTAAAGHRPADTAGTSSDGGGAGTSGSDSADLGAGAGGSRSADFGPRAGGTLLLAASLLAALVFSIHPLRVESVAWITERRDVVSGLFLLLMLVAYVRGAAIERAGGRATGHRIAAFCFFVMSLLGKATGVTAPIALLVLDVVPLRRLPASPKLRLEARHRAVLMEKVPYLAASLVIGIVAVLGQKQVGALKSTAAAGLVDRIGLAVYGSMFYVWKTIVPGDLSPLYELRQFSVSSPGTLTAAAALVVVTIVAVLCAKRWPAVPAAWLAYLVLVAPVSGFARAGNQIAADRYTYLATLPVAFLAGAAWLALARRRRVAARVAGAVAVLGLAGLTFAQTRVWHDSISLWTHAVRLDPGGERAAINLASAYVDADRFSDAEAIYRERIRTNPGDADSRYSLGMVLLRTGRVTEAERTFRDLVRDRPEFPMGHYGLGVFEMQRGNRDAARAAWERSLELQPTLEMARQALEEFVR